MTNKISLLFLLLTICFVISGCGPKTAHVSGKVTYKGEPAPSIRVLFQPNMTTLTIPEPAIGETNAQGEFQLQLAESKKSGVVPGDYIVFFSWIDPNAVKNPPDGLKPNPSPYKLSKELVESGMKFNVPENGTREAVFELWQEKVAQ
ncbi:MAG: hypothetical protein ACRCUY_01425 [Thermoguttaceae bacterium]